MKFEAYRDLLSVIQIAIATAAVAAGGGGSVWAIALAAVASLIAFVRPLPIEASKPSQRVWAGIVVIALAASVFRAFQQSDFLDAGIDMLLLLVVQRFFNRQRCREHLQLLLLGSVLMVIAAVINADLNYPVLLAGFLAVATMGLIINQLLSEGERLGARVRHDLRREGRARRRSLWRAAALVAGISAMSGLVVFFLFPRFGVGVFLRGSMPTGVTSGFSDEVRLGGFGRIKTDATVIMRMKPSSVLADEQRTERLLWHLRGSAFDHYEGGVWSRAEDSQAPATRKMQRVQGFSVFVEEGTPVAGPDLEQGIRPGRRRTIGPRPIAGYAASTQSVRMLVTLEDIGTELLFAASEPLGIQIRARSPIERTHRANLRDRGLRQVAILNKAPGPVQYEFLSRIGEPSRAELLAIGDPELSADMARYVQAPPSLSDEFSELAQQITEGTNSRLERTEAVMDYLRGYAYTLDLESSPRVQAGADPIEGFVFDTKAGHCEYFATAMALLLREAGVPTRNVNGYYGAHYNDVGEFYAVRQADAHSWVEVYFEGLGWVTFDPTPPSGRTAGDAAPFWPAASLWVDALRNAYLEYVIDFNLGTQLGILREMGIQSDADRRFNPGALAAWVGLGSLGVLAVFMLLRRRRRPLASAEARIYMRLLRRLAARGHERQPGESARRFAHRLAEHGASEAGALREFAELYEERRFGPRKDGGALGELERLARRVFQS